MEAIEKMRNADRLVQKLTKMGYTIYGASFHILHHKYQEYLNRAAGEAAPTWELLAEPLWRYDKVFRIGRAPTFDPPDGTRHTGVIYSHFPLSHVLKTPLEEWDVGMDEVGRLWVGTTMLPETW